MNNTIFLLGRLVSDLQINEIDNKKTSIITLAINRCYKNEEGIYDTDFIPVKLLGQVAERTAEYCGKGDLIGVRGVVNRLSGEELEIVAEKVSFLSNGRNNVSNSEVK